MPDIASLWFQMVTWLSSHAVMPVLSVLHIQNTAGDPKEIAEAGMLAILQIGIIGLIFRPLESLAPAERWQDRRLTKVDRLYTLLMLLGLFPLFSYLVLMPFGNLLGESSGGTASPVNVRHLVPWFDHHPCCCSRSITSSMISCITACTACST